MRRLRTLFVLALLSAAGCDTAFEPFSGGEHAYTLLGYLDTDADTQFVRVVPLRRVVDRPAADTIDAVVTSTDLQTQTTVTWRDSLVRFEDGSYGHVFRALFRPAPERTYRLTVERSDGARATAVTTVPARPGDPDLVYGAPNESGRYAPLYWPGVSSVIDVDVTYSVNPYSCLAAVPPPKPPPSEARRVSRHYTGDARGGPVNNGTEWQVLLQLPEDREHINDALGLRSIDQCVILYALEVRIATPSTGWEPPGGVWDPDVLAQPGTFSNVEGGLGFWGSVARSTVEWQLAPLAFLDMNFVKYFPNQP